MEIGDTFSSGILLEMVSKADGFGVSRILFSMAAWLLTVSAGSSLLGSSPSSSGSESRISVLV